MACKHLNTLLTQQDTIVCTDCGVEKPVLLNNPSYHTHLQTAPLARFYSRPHRWFTLLKKVVGIHSGPNVKDPIWSYLKALQPFPSVTELKQSLRSCKLENKHYPCIHIFARCFCSDYVKPKLDPQKVLKKLRVHFDFVLQLHNRSGPKGKFFSYNWLLEQSLSLHNFLEYMPFIKKLKCSNRRSKYVKKLIKLYEIHVESGGRVQLNSRLQNALLPLDCHHNQLLMPQHPEKRMAACFQNFHNDPRVSSEQAHVLARMYAIAQGVRKGTS